ncbi:MAG TPA: DUF4276 family protein [Gemmataceae bacterium]|nr:DUF4276 family protein [Gemmataceae bacterium]
MSSLKRLVLFVEGQGDEDAVPVLVRQLLTEYNAWDCLFLDPNPFRVKKVTDLIGRNEKNWRRYLGAARKRSNLGGILLLLDGDVRLAKRRSFCARDIGCELSRLARQEGAGSLFSVASVLALQEFESWLIAGIDAIAGKPLPDGRPGVRAGTTAPAGDLEVTPRDAKQWLRQHMDSGYKPTTDQEPLTRLLIEDLGPLRARGMRSFRRLESALKQLVAVRSGRHVATPEGTP